MTSERKGPLKGIRVLELANIGPLQHAGMILAVLLFIVVRRRKAAATKPHDRRARMPGAQRP